MKKKLSLFMAIVMMLSVFSFNVVAMAAEEVNGPFAFIESHPQNAAFSGNSVDVTGWALKTEGTVSKIDMSKTSVSIGGSAATATVVPVSRPDVKAAFAGANLPDAIFDTVGYKATVDISGITAGTESHVLKLTFNDSTGAMIVSQELNFTKAAKEIKPNLLNIDLPTANAQIGEATFDVSGWALASKDGETDAIAKIGVKVGSAAEGFVADGDRFERTDVKNALAGYPEASYANAGFTYTADASELNATGATTVAVTTYDSADTAIRTLHLSVMKVAPGNKELLAVIDSPKAGDKFINSFAVSGWAFLGVNNADGIAKVKVVATDSEGTQKTAEFTKNVARTDLTKDVIKGYPDASYVTPGFTSGAIDISNLKNGKVTVVTSFLDAAGNAISGNFGGSSVEIEKATTAPKDTIVIIDAPANGTVVADGKLSVSGWALATANGTASNIDAITVKVEGAATETPVTATATRIARTDITGTVVPGYGDYANAGYEAKDINLASLAKGTLTVTVKVTHKDGSAPVEVSRIIQKEISVITLNSVNVISATQIVVSFDKAPATAFDKADFVVKSDAAAAPTISKDILSVSSTADKMTYTLTIPSITIGHNVTVAPGTTAKFAPATGITVKYADKFAVTELKVNSETKLTLDLTNAPTVTLTNDNIKDFIVLYEQENPSKATKVITPSALLHDKDLAPGKVALTIPTLANTSGKIKVNSGEASVDFLPPVYSSAKVTRLSAGEALFSVKSDEVAGADGKIRYILDATGTATEPAIEAFATVGGKVVETAFPAAATTNVTLAGLTSSVTAKLYVVYYDNNTPVNKTAVIPYTISGAVQAKLAGREIEKGSVVGTIKTKGVITNPAYVIISDTVIEAPLANTEMPKENGVAVLSGENLRDTAVTVGKYLTIYEAKGTSATDKLLVGAFYSKLITQADIKAADAPAVTANSKVASGKSLSVTPIDSDVLTGNTMYVSKATSNTAFTVASAVALTYAPTASIVTMPTLTDGTYYLYLVHTQSGAVSVASNNFVADNIAPVITLVADSLKRTDDTNATFSVKVDKDIIASGTKKFGIIGSMDSTDFITPTAAAVNTAVVKDQPNKIDLSGTKVTGHGLGIDKLEKGTKYITLVAIDEAGNMSAPLQITLKEYFDKIPGTSYIIDTPSDSDPAKGHIKLKANNRTILANASGTAVEFEQSAPGYDVVLKLLTSLATDDSFAIDTNGKIVSITKASSAGLSTVELTSAEVAASLILNNTTTAANIKTLKIKGNIGTKLVTLNGSEVSVVATPLFDIAELTSGKVSIDSGNNFNTYVKAGTQTTIVTNATNAVTINGVSVKGNATEVKPVAGGLSIAVSGSQAIDIVAESVTGSDRKIIPLMTDNTNITFTGRAQQGKVTLTGLAVKADEEVKVLSLTGTTTSVFTDVDVMGGCVDVSNLTLDPSKVITVPTGATENVKIAAGIKGNDINIVGGTHNVIVASAGKVNVTGGPSTGKIIINGTITDLSVPAGIEVEATSTSAIANVTVVGALTKTVDLSKVDCTGKIVFGTLGGGGSIKLNPSDVMFYGSAATTTTGSWDVDAQEAVFGGKKEVTVKGVTLKSEDGNKFTLSGTATAGETPTFFAHNKGDGLKVTVNPTTKNIIIDYWVTTSDTSLSKASQASVSVVSTSGVSRSEASLATAASQTSMVSMVSASNQTEVSKSEASAATIASQTSIVSASKQTVVSQSEASVATAASQTSIVSASKQTAVSQSEASVATAASQTSMVSASAQTEVSKTSTATVVSKISTGSMVSIVSASEQTEGSMVSIVSASEQTEVSKVVVSTSEASAWTNASNYSLALGNSVDADFFVSGDFSTSKKGTPVSLVAPVINGSTLYIAPSGARSVADLEDFAKEGKAISLAGDGATSIISTPNIAGTYIFYIVRGGEIIAIGNMPIILKD